MVEDKVIRIIKECFPAVPENINLSSRLVEDLGMDEIDKMDVIFALEDEFDIEIIDEDFEKWLTIQDIVNHIESSYMGKD